MADVRYFRTVINGVPVVTAPADIDITNAEQLRTVLLEATARYPAVVVDMTCTRFCDSSGIHTLLRAHKRALAGGGELRLAVPADGAVLRIMNLTCLDRFIPCFSSVADAVAPTPAAAVPKLGTLAGLPCSNRAPGPEETTLSPYAELQAQSDNMLLARLRGQPWGSAEREVICDILVSRYAALVRSCVRPYRRSPEPAEDLLQVGYVGLLKAINNFDPGCGDSLSAYAAPCISGEIKRHFRDRRWQIRVRRQVQELLLEMRSAEEILTQQLGRTPDDSELARHLGVPADDVLEARRAHLVFTTYSLDAPLSHDDDPALLIDILGEDDPAVSHATDIEAVHAHLDELPEREQRILMLRFYGNLTQEQIGARLGISQMHVSRLLERALTYLRAQITKPA